MVSRLSRALWRVSSNGNKNRSLLFETEFVQVLGADEFKCMGQMSSSDILVGTRERAERLNYVRA